MKMTTTPSNEHKFITFLQVLIIMVSTLVFFCSSSNGKNIQHNTIVNNANES
jgi:hypothetical protein